MFWCAAYLLSAFLLYFVFSIPVFGALAVFFFDLFALWQTDLEEDRLNERIWVEDGLLYHFIQMNIGAGLNYRTADERANVYIIDIATIRNAKYDPEGLSLTRQVRVFLIMTIRRALSENNGISTSKEKVTKMTRTTGTMYWVSRV